MKLSVEFKNGLFIFLGIGIYFLLLNVLGLSKNEYLRIFNLLFVFFGIRRTIQSNFNNGKTEFLQNVLSTGITGFVGVFLSIIGLIIYINLNGGQPFLNTLSKGFLFGGKPSVAEFCFGLFFEGIASTLIVVFISMLYWSPKTTSSSD